MNRGEFANEVTKKLGCDVTLHTRRALQAQIQTETPRKGGAKNNPFNTTLPMKPGSTDFNFIVPGVAVQNYVSAAQGTTATARTLLEEGHGYRKIRRRLKLNGPAWAIVDAIIESDWGTGAAAGLTRTLIEEVLDDILHDRKPNKLDELEAVPVAQ